VRTDESKTESKGNNKAINPTSKACKISNRISKTGDGYVLKNSYLDALNGL